MTIAALLVKSLLMLIPCIILSYVYFFGSPFAVHGSNVTVWNTFLEESSLTMSSLQLFGSSKPRVVNSMALDKIEVLQAVGKLNHFVNTSRVAISERNLVVYSIEDIGSSDSSIDLVINNVKVFVNAALSSSAGAEGSAFYWFNVAGQHTNPAMKLIPSHLPNVAVVRWTHTLSGVDSFMQTIHSVDADDLHRVGAVFSTSSAMRGPLQKFEEGAWISDFRHLLDANDVGLVGPVISCDGGAHVRNDMFAVRSVMIPPLLEELRRFRTGAVSVSLDEHFERRLTEVVLAQNYRIASLLNFKRTGETHLLGECKEVFRSPDGETCNVDPTEALFIRWTGDSWGGGGFVCGKGAAMAGAKQNVVAALSSVTMAHNYLPDQASLVLPETAAGGPLYDMYSQYEKEHKRRTASVELKHGREEDSKVCFLVRTAAMHDPNSAAAAAGKIKYVEMDLDVLARSLLMQTNGNWQAYFIITDPSPFEARLQEILASYQDPRLSYFQVDMRYRPAFTVVDAGYTTTDYVLNALLARKECKWVSATNGDNAYGSEVVERILSASHAPGSAKQPDMLLLPMDSRNFADQDFRERGDLAWDRRCVGIEAMAEFSQLAATADSIPKVARLDLAAMVLRRKKLASENVRFGNFSDITRFHCAGCNDGYFAQYLVRNLGWSYTRLPVDGLRSLMFHGPSPTHCIAAGNVWFDHPQVGKVGCLSQATVYRMLVRDVRRQKSHHYFDWQHFNTSIKVCLRLNQRGFNSHATVQRRLDTSEPLSQDTGGDSVALRRRLASGGVERKCDWAMYLKLNSDLQKDYTVATASQHYELHGRAENRTCYFDWRAYLLANPDLAKVMSTQQQALDHYINYGRNESRLHAFPEWYSWVAYLENNIDLYHAHIHDPVAATSHFANFGYREGRSARVIAPEPHSWDAAQQKLGAYLGATKLDARPSNNIVVYHVEDIGSNDNAYELTANNVKLFVSAVLRDVGVERKTFYWFNVAALTDNPFTRLLPAHLPNVAVVHWLRASSAFNSFAQTVKLLDTSLPSLAGAVFSTSSGVRGPLDMVEGGAWIGEFRRLLDANNVGLVGPVIGCKGVAHVQNHIFALHTAAVPALLAELKRYYEIQRFDPIEEYFRKHLSSALQGANFRIASLQHARQKKGNFYVKQCPVQRNVAGDGTLCDVAPRDVLFLRWSGESLGAKGYECGKGMAMSEQRRAVVKELSDAASRQLLQGMASDLSEKLQLVLPEAPMGWQIYEEFNREYGLVPTKVESAAAAIVAPGSQVCFFVRLGEGVSDAKTATTSSDAEHLIHTLLVQSNAHWEARLIGEANNALQTSIRGLGDARISLLSAISAAESVQFSQCGWIVLTDETASYGSEVVQMIHTAARAPAAPDLLLLATDSAQNAQQDYERRGEKGWERRCVGVETMVSLYQTTYTALPVPQAGRVKLASVALRRASLASELAAAGNGSLPMAMKSIVDDGTYVQYLVRSRGWTYSRLSMDGLRSTVFLDPSPTHCIAAGNVWLDHPCLSKVRCLSHDAVNELRAADVRGNEYDWQRFYFRDQVCLRLSKAEHDRARCE